MSLKKSVIVHGPMGCGKTRNAEALKKFFGMANVFDSWNGSTPFPARGTLVLTNALPPVSQAVSRRDRIIPYAVAAKAAGVQS